MSEIKKITKIKSTLFSRSMSIAKLGLNASLSYAANKITNSPFENFLNSQAIHLTKELGELKGSIMKAGQMLSMYSEHFLPAEANAVLKTLQSDSPSIDWPIMRGHLNTYLSSALIDELEINPEPIGSASMGQVHLAVIKATGEKIALKIQYPNLEKAIDSDIAALKKILSLTRVLPSGLDLTLVYEEIKMMLRQELNYNIEAENTILYKQLVGNDSRYLVPRVYTRYSNKHVLATEYMEGLRADHPLVQNLSQGRRNKISENFIELYFKEIFDWNLVQTDPHLGNYKIQIDSLGNDQLVLLDFGAAKKFTNPFFASYKKMIKGAIEKNDVVFLNASKELGFVIDTDKPEYVTVFKNFCFETVEPFSLSGESTYDWKKTDLPNRIVKKAFQFKNFDLRAPPHDILFLDRKTAGVFIFLSVLNAQINARKIVTPFLLQVSNDE